MCRATIRAASQNISACSAANIAAPASCTVSPARSAPRGKNPSDHFATWDVTTNGKGWTVETRYQFLRWEDVVRKDFVRPAWLKVANMFRAMARTIANGTYSRVFKTHWRFGFFAIYPLALTLAWMALGAAVGVLCLKLVAALGAPRFIAGMVGVVTGIGAFASALWLTEPMTYLLYICDDIDATDRFAHGERPDWDERLDAFAGYVVDAVRASDADEAIIVGHSSGSFLAVEVLDRALDRDPALGRHRPRLRLLTLGANFPIVGFHPQAQWFRDRLRRLAVAPDVDWVDYQSRHDIMNFWPFDPVAGHGIALGPDGATRRSSPSVSATCGYRAISGRPLALFQGPFPVPARPTSGWARPMITT